MNPNDTLSPPSEDHEVPAKRQKLDMSNLSMLIPLTMNPVSEEDKSGLTQKLIALRPRLLQTEITAAQFHKIRVQIDEVLRGEENNLEIYLKMNRETTKPLEMAFGTDMWSTQDVLKAEAAAEADMCQIKRRMREKFENLLMENPEMNYSSREDTSTFLQAQKNAPDNERELREEIRKIEVDLAHMLKDEWISQESDCTELEEESIKMQRLQSERVLWEEKQTLANALEEEVEPAKDIVSILHEAKDNQVLEEQLSIQNELNDADKLEQLMKFLPSTSDELPTNLQNYGSRDIVQVVSMQENNTPEVLNLSVPCPQCNKNNEDRKAAEPCLQIRVGKHSVLVSDSRYFKIDWKKYYTPCINRGLICNECAMIKSGKARMCDHIWAKHYGGGFKCPHCRHSRVMETRNGVHKHIQRFHPNTFTLSD